MKTDKVSKEENEEREEFDKLFPYGGMIIEDDGGHYILEDIYHWHQEKMREMEQLTLRRIKNFGRPDLSEALRKLCREEMREMMEREEGNGSF